MAPRATIVATAATTRARRRQEGHGRAVEAPGGVRGRWRPDAMRMGTARHSASHNPPKGVPYPVRGEDGSQ